MVTKEKLGRPAERLREQMKKLQLHSAKGGHVGATACHG